MKATNIVIMKEFLIKKGISSKFLDQLDLLQLEDLYNEEKRESFWAMGPTF